MVLCPLEYCRPQKKTTENQQPSQKGTIFVKLWPKRMLPLCLRQRNVNSDLRPPLVFGYLWPRVLSLAIVFVVKSNSAEESTKLDLLKSHKLLINKLFHILTLNLKSQFTPDLLQRWRIPRPLLRCWRRQVEGGRRVSLVELTRISNLNFQHVTLYSVQLKTQLQWQIYAQRCGWAACTPIWTAREWRVGKKPVTEFSVCPKLNFN